MMGSNVESFNSHAGIMIVVRGQNKGTAGARTSFQFPCGNYDRCKQEKLAKKAQADAFQFPCGNYDRCKQIQFVAIAQDLLSFNSHAGIMIVVREGKGIILKVVRLPVSIP